jgi:hypothetical protein
MSEETESRERIATLEERVWVLENLMLSQLPDRVLVAFDIASTPGGGTIEHHRVLLTEAFARFFELSNESQREVEDILRSEAQAIRAEIVGEDDARKAGVAQQSLSRNKSKEEADRKHKKQKLELELKRAEQAARNASARQKQLEQQLNLI